MRSPTEVSRALVRIANGIDSSRQPSRRLVARDLQRVLAAVEPASGRLKIVEKKHGDYDQIKHKTENNAYSCPGIVKGEWDGKPFEFSGTVQVFPTYEVEADEDGLYGHWGGSFSYLGEADDAVLTFNGQKIDLTNPSPEIQEMLDSKEFVSALDDVGDEANNDFRNSDASSDMLSDIKDAEAERRDPYAYRGLRQRDFL